jgi:folate-binding protein YgfZ
MQCSPNALYQPERSVIIVKGDDAFYFLQNILTNDLQELKQDLLQYSLLLTPQGKILYDFFIFQLNDNYFLEVNKNYLADILELLQKYKLRAAVEFQYAEKYIVILSEKKIANFSYPDPRCEQLGFRNYLDEKEYQGVDKMGLKNKDGYIKKRLQYLVPEHGEDFQPGNHFAMDLDMVRLNAISFNKGCYVGQEVAAKMFYRAKNKKIISAVNLKDNFEIRSNYLYKDSNKIGKILNNYGEMVLISQVVSK